MFGKGKGPKDLDRPPIAAADPEAVEVLRVWASPDGPQELTLKTFWGDPGAWGLLLVDVARHAALAYKREGHDAAKALERIRELFDAEWSSPTDDPKEIDPDR